MNKNFNVKINYTSNIKTFRIANSKLKIGDIGQLSCIGNVVGIIRSDGNSPLGIIIKKIRIVNKKTKEIKYHAVKLLFSRCEIETDNFDNKYRYPINAPLFINEDGQFTTNQVTQSRPSIGMVTLSPNINNNKLQLIWF